MCANGSAIAEEIMVFFDYIQQLRIANTEQIVYVNLKDWLN